MRVLGDVEGEGRRGEGEGRRGRRVHGKEEGKQRLERQSSLQAVSEVRETEQPAGSIRG